MERLPWSGPLPPSTGTLAAERAGPRALGRTLTAGGGVRARQRRRRTLDPTSRAGSRAAGRRLTPRLRSRPPDRRRPIGPAHASAGQPFRPTSIPPTLGAGSRTPGAETSAAAALALARHARCTQAPLDEAPQAVPDPSESGHPGLHPSVL